MKFLCVKCDSGMKMSEVSGPDESGSLAVVFRCEKCENRVAMLTNPFETQLVSSLGVTIGPEGKTTSKCPFTAVVKESIARSSPALASGSSAPAPDDTLAWTGAAHERLSRIPEFVRPMAKSGIEGFARSRGFSVIDESVLDQAGSLFSTQVEKN